MLHRFSQVYRRFENLKRKSEESQRLQKETVLEWHSRNLPKLRENYRNLPYVKTPQRQPDPITEFSDGIFALIKLLREAKIRVIVLGQPVLWKANMNSDEIKALWFFIDTPRGPVRPGASWLEEEMSRYNDVPKDISGALGVPYVDLNKKVAKTAQYFFDDCHFTDLGNVRVTTEIYPTVKEQVKGITETGRSTKQLL